MRSKYKILLALLIILYLILLITTIISISKKNKELSSLTSENSDLESKISTLEVSISAVSKTNSPLETQVELIRKNRDALIKKENDIEAKYRTTIKESKMTSTEEIENIKKKVDQYQGDLDRLNDLNDHYKKKFDLLTEEYNTLNNKKSKDKQELPSINDGKFPYSQMDSVILKNSDAATGRYFDYPTRLLYRATRDGFLTEIFHSKCDYVKPTLVVTLLRSGLIIIGYTEQSWEGNFFKEDPHAFLYNISIDRKYKILHPENAIYCDPNRFPVFGNGDFVISSPTFSNFPTSYGGENAKNLQLTLGTQNNDITELEVFEVLK